MEKIVNKIKAEFEAFTTDSTLVLLEKVLVLDSGHLDGEYGYFS